MPRVVAAAVAVSLVAACSSTTVPTAEPAPSTTVGAPSTTVATREPIGGADLDEVGPGRLSFHHVLLVVPVPDGNVVLGIDCSGTVVEGAEEYLCVGPVVLDDTSIDRAEAFVAAGDQWAVNVGFRPGADDGFDRAAAECADQTETCPAGRLAIVFDGAIVSAPTVQQRAFGGEVVISGGFTEAEAAELAAILAP